MRTNSAKADFSESHAKTAATPVTLTDGGRMRHLIRPVVKSTVLVLPFSVSSSLCCLAVCGHTFGQAHDFGTHRRGFGGIFFFDDCFFVSGFGFQAFDFAL